MSSPSYSTYRISECLSKVMDEIGVNETIVMKRRRTCSLNEAFMTIMRSYIGQMTVYYFGSKIEGSTTDGLRSDFDTTHIPNFVAVIQTIREWKCGCHNLMIVQNENIQPGYCYLQNMSVNNVHHGMYSLNEVLDKSGMKLLIRSDNKLVNESIGRQSEINGPAFMLSADLEVGIISQDIVYSYRGETLPHEVKLWIQRQRHCKWPTVDVLKDCEKSGCFAVPKGSPESVTPELEWIISTALQERYLMFSLNITQIRCYILMKVFLKTFIDPYVDDVLTSFMCKNVLWYCITNSSQDWHTGNLFSYLQLCLFMLKERIVQRNCPHFIIPGNNLLAGRMTDSQQRQLRTIINDLIRKGEQCLFEIQIDGIGECLKRKLNNKKEIPFFLVDSTWLRLSTIISSELVASIARGRIVSIIPTFLGITQFRAGIAQLHMFNDLFLTLKQYSTLDDVKVFRHCQLDIVHEASRLLIPLVRSTLGSMLACKDIVSKRVISNAALEHLIAGKESDVLSGRLKFISVLYCSGDMGKTRQELNNISANCMMSDIFLLCPCFRYKLSVPTIECLKSIESKHEEAIKTNLALCTRFLKIEILCGPHELNYEFLRAYIQGDQKFRTWNDSFWMDTIEVNSICYYYFLQYKMHGHLHRKAEQQQALRCLEACTRSEVPHKETSLNLLGQCFEQENRHIEALQCYVDSLKYCPRNNAAKFLLCIQLYKLKLLMFV